MSIRTSRGAEDLRRYFHSGWAFLIPYLTAYLLYYWLKWPVNPPVAAGVGLSVPGSSFSVPSLLHVYWFLHAINVGLAAVALVSWWREQESGDRSQEIGVRRKESEDGCQLSDVGNPDPVPTMSADPKLGTPTAPDSVTRFPLFRFPAFPIFRARFPTFPLFRARFPAFLPWLLLALLFYIPGVYLEFPADTWEHYARINEWSWIHTVGEHTAWAKSSYFLAYSLLGRIAPPTRQLFWLDFYYTGCCLLLCWQYYRLARAVGLGERASFIFVLVQAFTFGNNIFGFYRYYGISSSIFAQLGAVAFIRVALEAVTRTGSHQGSQRSQRNPPCDPCVPSWQKEAPAEPGPTDAPAAHEGIACEQAPIAPLSPLPPAKWLGLLAVRFPGFPLSRFSVSGFPVSRFAGLPLSAFQAALIAACLLALTAFNHPQGLGIAGLGLLAVIVWRLIEWKRSMVFWLAAAAIALSVAAILWWPRNPALDAAYRPAGWLTGWYGFNLFSPSSPAFDRTMAILGFVGVVNLITGLFLLRRNHVAAWLTVVPLFALCMPFVAIPFANALAQRDVMEILTFHRLLLAIPAGMALVSAFIHVAETGARRLEAGGHGWRSLFATPFSLSLAGIATLLLLPASGPHYSRTWNTLMVAAGDLTMSHVLADLDRLPFRQAQNNVTTRLLTTPGISLVAYATGVREVPYAERRKFAPIFPPITSLVDVINANRANGTLYVPVPSALYTPLSHCGYLSGHWLPQEVALTHAAAREIETAAVHMGGRKVEGGSAIVYALGNAPSAVTKP